MTTDVAVIDASELSEECGQTLWAIALKTANKFCGSKGDSKVHGHTVEDLAITGIVHVLVQAKRGKLDKVPEAERWNIVARILWNKIIDESRRYTNRFELQSPTLTAPEGDALDSDKALEFVAHDKELAFRTGCPVKRADLRRLESLVDAALVVLGPDRLFVELRFGMTRVDVIDGDFHYPAYNEPMTLQDLANIGYGHDCKAAKRHLDACLKKMKETLQAEMTARKFVNFSW